MHPTAVEPSPLRSVVLALLVVLVAALALVDSYPWSGPVLLTLTDTHGVHAADLVVVALAGTAVLLLGVAVLGGSLLHGAARGVSDPLPA